MDRCSIVERSQIFPKFLRKIFQKKCREKVAENPHGRTNTLTAVARQGWPVAPEPESLGSRLAEK
jgi:hypothetical protein